MKIKSIRERLLASTLMAGVAAVGAPVGVAIIASVAPTSAVAQDYTSGTLTGSVEDAAGAPVAGATVTVTSPQGTVRTVTTGADGNFRVPALPVGRYTVNVAGGGLSVTNNVAIEPGQVSYSFILGDESAVEGVVVTAQRQAAFTETDVGLTVDVQELSERVPVGRSINAITLLTPGAQQVDPTIAANGIRRSQSVASLAGTSAAESVYYINGLNVTDQRSFLGYSDLPFEFVQTIETKAGGFQAEFGRGTGGVVNIVTRSGTNEWTGGASAFWSPNFLREQRGVAYGPGGTNSQGQNVFNQFSRSEQKDFTVHLGGPLIRDRLFFFGVYNARDSELSGAHGFTSPTTATGTQLRTKDNSPRWGAKIDFVFNPDHRLEATIFSDRATLDTQSLSVNRTSGQVTAQNPRTWSDSGGLNQIYQYRGTFTNWFTLSALYGKTEAAYRDYGPAIELPGVLDYVALGGGYASVGRQAGPLNLSGDDLRETYRVDGDFYFNLMGDHHLRIGYDREDLTTSAESFYSGGALYYAVDAAECSDATDVPVAGIPAAGCLEVLTFGNQGTYTAEQSAWYIQDSWDILPNLSLQLGIRNDIYDYKNVEGESYIQIEDQYAPRLGFNWDPTGQGVDRVYGSYGRYYLPIATNTSLRASSGEVYTDEYFQAVRGADGLLVFNGAFPVLGPQVGDTSFLSPPGAPDPRQVAEAELEPMFESEYILGYERRFDLPQFGLGRVTAGVRYVHRDLSSTIEDTAIGDAVGRYCIRTNNTTCITAGGDTPYALTQNPGETAAAFAIRQNAARYHFSETFPYVLINPGDGARVYVDLQADPRTNAAGAPNPAFNPQFIDLTAADLALDEVERTYDALQFTFERAFDGLWGLQGSYTWSRSEGNYEGAIKSDIGQTDVSLTQDYDHRTNQLNSFGLLPNHRAHQFKLFGSYSPVEWMTIGANFTAQSGRPFSCIGYAPLSADVFVPNRYSPSSWFCPKPGGTNSQEDIIATPRGSQGETPWTYQLDLNFGFQLMDFAEQGTLRATVDVFNVFDFDEVTRVVEQGAVRPGGARAPYQGFPRNYQAPRTVRFGLRYAF